MRALRENFILVWLFIVWPSLLWATKVQALGDTTTTPTNVQILTNFDAIAPGGSVRIGVVFDVPAGWHIYGAQPGDTGLPTKVELQLPDKVSSGPTLYPASTRFELPGNIVANGYSGRVMLARDISVASDAASLKALPIQVKVSWLDCSVKVCIPGRRSFDLVIPLAEQPQAQNEQLFMEWGQKFEK